METHELPEELNPVGDKCYPLFIPDHDHYRSLLLGAIRALTEDDYYREASYNLTDVQTVTEQWRGRTLTPLVQAMNDESPCGGAGITMLLREYQRNTNQAVSANTDTAIIWNDGHVVTPTDTILSPVNGYAIITAWVQFQFAVSNQVTAWILVNSTAHSRQDADANRQFHMRQLAFVVPVLSDDEIKVIVRANAAGTIVQTNGLTRMNIMFLENQ